VLQRKIYPLRGTPRDGARTFYLDGCESQ